MIKGASTPLLRFLVDSSIVHSERLHDESIEVALGGNFVQLEPHVPGMGGAESVGIIGWSR